jgi:hypothetical protein
MSWDAKVYLHKAPGVVPEQLKMLADCKSQQQASTCSLLLLHNAALLPGMLHITSLVT